MIASQLAITSTPSQLAVEMTTLSWYQAVPLLSPNSSSDSIPSAPMETACLSLSSSSTVTGQLAQYVSLLFYFDFESAIV